MLPELLETQPYEITADSFLIPTLAFDPIGGGWVGVHSMVIRGAEPVVVDTGVPLVREAWLANVTSVVDLEDVRWIYISHDDHDHIGSLEYMLEHCPHARLIASFPIVNRLAGDYELPLERMRFLNSGESLDIGDRTITAVVPPMFDSPSTRGLFDSKTRLYWAADSFAALHPGAVYEADDVPADLYDPTFEILNLSNTPWAEWLDLDRYAAHVQQTAALHADVIASAHGPILRGARIDDAFARTRDLVGKTPLPAPGQDFLEMLLSMMLTPAS